MTLSHPHLCQLDLPMDSPGASLDNCTVCKKNPLEPGFLLCKPCWDSGLKLCFRCRRSAAAKGAAFCDACWSRRAAACDLCKTKPSDAGQLLCGGCWDAVSQCPLCKIEKPPSRWDICRKCFHAGASA